MAKVRWASSRFKGEGSSEKCLTTAKTERKGRVRQENIRVCHGVEFLCLVCVLEITGFIV